MKGYLTSTVTSLSLKTDKNLEFNNKRRSEKQDPSNWYPIQSYGREAPAFYEKDVSDSDSNTNKAMKTSKRTPQTKHKREKGKFTTGQNTKHIKGTTTYKKKTEERGTKHRRQKHINRESKKRNGQNEMYFRSHQINPYLNDSFHDINTHHSSHYTQHYSSFIENHLWPENLNMTDDRLKLPPTDSEIHTIYLQGHKIIPKNANKDKFNRNKNGAQPVSDSTMSIKETGNSKNKNIQQPAQVSSPPNKVSSSSKNTSQPQSYVLRNRNHQHFGRNFNTYFETADRSLYINKIFKNFQNENEQSTPFIRNEKTSESDLNKNNVNMKKVSHDAKQELQQQIINKTKENFHKKIDDALNAQKVWFHNLKDQSTDYENIDNDTISLWQPWAHRVKDDAKISSFINRTLNRNIDLFYAVEQKTKDMKWKEILRELAEAYQEKFNKFSEDTKKHKVKSRMGTERVILNCIEVSNRIIKRLLNYVLDDMDKKGHLRNTRPLNIIAKELKQKTKAELKRACLKLGICRSRNGFTEFVIDFLTTILSQGDKKFELAYNSLTAAIKNTDWSKTLGENSDETLKTHIEKFKNKDLMYKRSAVMVIKSIIAKRNSPLIVYGDSNVGQVNKTIALLEIVNILDKYVPESDKNFKVWMDLNGKLNNFVKGSDDNVQETMLAFVQHIKDVINSMNSKSFTQILYNSQIVLS
ncbi:unnamed protein product [Arctia plantaginis]|uniref:Uncharacterized protein n=1 Tax=Arctia plantaginis TaxID=874455 RepID=A0A8S0ZX02_ARCPL|nr:unnamed protein product [Arctia plantaginis]